MSAYQGLTMNERTDEQLIMQDIVRAELKSWVPVASQGVIHRAGKILGVPQPASTGHDCGSEPGQHALFPDWVVGLYVLRCCTCMRIFWA